MNNFIEYFYRIKVENVIYNNKYYSFIYNNYVYRLYIYENNIDLKLLYDINKKLINNTLMSQMILNKDNEIISSYNGISYILIKIFANINKRISLEEISFVANSFSMEKLNINWGILWSNKIDYLEDLINENGKKYPLIVDSFNYFVGMCENAIAYFNSIVIDKNYKYVISHKKIKFDDMVDSLYNPLNIIFDYRVRDISEYIKNSFFNNNYNIFNEIIVYLNKNYLSLTDIKLLISRLLYPSFYFDMYEDILIDNKEEKIILNIISQLDEYEEYLNKVITFFKKYYNIDEIQWLKKRRL